MEMSLLAALTSSDAQQEEKGEPDSASPEPGRRSHSVSFLLARLLFGGVLTFMALDGFNRNEGRVESARSNGVPNPEFMVPFATSMLLSGSIGILVWRLPRLAAAAVAGFFVGVTPVQHAFWKEDPENRRGQQISFLKNSAMLGGAILFFDTAQQERNRD